MRYLNLWNDQPSVSPWRGLMDLQRKFDRMVEQGFDGGTSGNDESYFHPSMEVEENDSHYLVSVDVPGMSKKDIKLEVRDNHLFISGERKKERKNDGYTERTYGKFHRVITLPANVDAEKVEAHYEDGVLSLALPKAEVAKSRHIKIGEGKGSFFEKFLGGSKEAGKEQKTVSASAAAH